jgi:hypothetical protein
VLENLIIYGAVYKDVHAALADLKSFEELNYRASATLYDAAVIELHDALPHSDALPHIVKRVTRPTLELIPELVARGRPPIGVLAEPLGPGEAALVVVGRTEIEKTFKSAVLHSGMTSARPLDPAEVGAITQSAP